MPSREDITYFGAGPALLPTPVLQSAAESLVNFNSTGLGLAEHSHRSSLAEGVLKETKESLRSFLSVPDSHEILFMQGGGSGQFSAVASNIVTAWVHRRTKELASGRNGLTSEAQHEINDTIKANVRDDVLQADYIVTGSWSLKAAQEAARLLGDSHVNIAVDARKFNDGKFGVIPDEKEWKLTSEKHGVQPAYVYYCDNETVDGVEFPGFPASLEQQPGKPKPVVVADMSSNILSRKVDMSKFGVIFAGAQKNIGLTGLTIVIVDKTLLPPKNDSPNVDFLRNLQLPITPVVLDYPTIAANNSLYNTLPIFDVYVAGAVIKSLLETHGSAKVSGMEAIADKKAAAAYAVLDKWEPKGVFTTVTAKNARSRMNICFRIGNKGSDEKDFLDGSEKRGLTGLKGHRSVGGIRVSNYNSVPVEGFEKLVAYMEEFASQHLSAR